VAKQCDHCGKILPSDTIRYCPGCGKLVASSRPAKRSLSEDPPAWMKQLETSLTNNRSKMPLRELNVKVWDEEETRDLTFQQSGMDSGGDNLDVMDNLPTNPLMVASSPKISTPSSTHSNLSVEDVDEVEVAEELPTNPELTSLSQNIPVNRVQSSHGTGVGNGKMSYDQIEDIATRPYAAQPRNLSHEIGKPGQQQRQAMQPPTGFANSPAMQRRVTLVPPPQSQIPPAQPSRQTPPVSMPVPPLTRPKKGNRIRLAIMFGLLFILLLGGVIAWVIVAQPFSVPEITKTTRNFKDTSLAVSLQYPQNWTVDVNKQNGTVIFYDDNRTDQVNITVVVAGNQSIDQYRAKTVSSVGITAQRTQPEVSFAGATWQQIQGSVQESGANYTATLLVTLHAEHYYSILLLAPSPTYPLEEQLVFSKMRSSFQF
jgi:hypothetical protein